MEQNFETSFIPKKPLAEERTVATRPVGLFTIISIFIFVTVVVATGGLYLYQGILTKSVNQKQADLVVAKDRFELSKITQLQTLDKRLNAATEILSKHIAISPIFKALQSLTMKTVRYTKFSYDFSNDKGAKVNVKMSGQGVGYQSIALQADLFTKNKYFISPVFSNLTLEQKTGNVTFDLEFSVDPTFVDYQQTLATSSSNNQ